MSADVNIADSEVDDLLWKAGLTLAEIEECRIAYPEVKLVLWAFQQAIANRLAKEIVRKLFADHDL